MTNKNDLDGISIPKMPTDEQIEDAANALCDALQKLTGTVRDVSAHAGFVAGAKWLRDGVYYFKQTRTR